MKTKRLYYTIENGVPTKRLMDDAEVNLYGNGKLFDMIGTEVLMDTKNNPEEPNNLYCSKNTSESVEYITENLEGKLRFFKSTVHPENLTDEQRHDILNYCLSSFDKDEIVNYNDLFLHFGFIEEVEQL